MYARKPGRSTIAIKYNAMFTLWLIIDYGIKMYLDYGEWHGQYLHQNILHNKKSFLEISVWK